MTAPKSDTIHASPNAPAGPRTLGRGFLVALLALGALALAMRVATLPLVGGGEEYLAWARDHYFGSISSGYVESAERLIDGEGYRDLLRPPGYALILAGMARAGLSPDGWRIAQAALDSCAVIALAVTAFGLGVRRPLAIAIALPVAVYPPWTVGATLLLAEWISPLIVAVAVASLVSMHGRGRAWQWGALGALIGCATLVRPDLVVLGPLVGVVWALRWLRGGATVTSLGLLVGCAAAPLLLWGVHNRAVHGHFVILSTSGGSALYQGLGVIENDLGYELGDRVTADMLRAQGHAWGSVEGDRELKRRWREAVARHPGHVLRVTAHRWSAILSSIDRPLGMRADSVQMTVTNLPWLTLLGAVILLARRRPDLCVVMCIPLLLGLLSTGLTHTEARYVRFVPFTALLAIGVILTTLVDATACLHDRLANRRVAATARAVGGAVLVAAPLAAALLALAAASDLRAALRQHRAAERLQTIVEVNDGSGGGAQWTATSMSWSVMPGAQAITDGNGVTIVTTDAPFGAAASAEIPSDGVDAFGIRLWGRFGAEGDEAFARIVDGERTLAQVRLAGTGPWTLVAGVDPSGRADSPLRLTIVNNNRFNRASTLHLDRIEILLDGAPHVPLVAVGDAWRSIGRRDVHGPALPAPSPASWTSEGEGTIVVDGDVVRVVTDIRSSGYQASTRLEVTGDWIAVRYVLTLESGGASIGLLSGDRSRWLASHWITQGGRHEGWLVAPTAGMDRVVLMCTNHRPEGGVSRFVVSDVGVLRPADGPQ